MFAQNRIVVVMPAYNAAATLLRTYDEVMATGVVDHVVVVDDASRDKTATVAHALPNTTLHVHQKNRGYGGNQKSCYRLALEAGADIVVMVHPDYQYTPALIPAMVAMITTGVFDCVLASRILGGQALRQGMPWWRYGFNRFLTLTENLMTGAKLSEYHTGYRAFSAKLLRAIPLGHNSEDFVFDNQMLLQVLWYGFRIAEVTCPTRYHAEASSVNFKRSVRYGFGCLGYASLFALARMGVIRPTLFPRLESDRS